MSWILRIAAFGVGVVVATYAFSSMLRPGGHGATVSTGKPFVLTTPLAPTPFQMDNTSIPHIVHMTWKNKNILQDLAPNVISWIKLHPHWQIRFWTDADVKPFITKHYPAYAVMFERWKWGGVKTADALRCFLLHHYGGVYADLDMESTRPMDDFMKEHSLIISTEPREHTLVIFGKDHLASNALMASRPGHPYWPIVFEEMKKMPKDAPVLKATGPVIIDRLAEAYVEAHPAATTPKKDSMYLAPPRMFHPFYDPAMDYHCKRFVQQQAASKSKTKEALEGVKVCERLKAENYKQDKTVPQHTYTAHHWSHQWICPTCVRKEVSIDKAVADAAIMARKTVVGR